ncbi:rhodanese-like domain-containing protein [Streptomyces sp. AD55]|uniref:rhodanese-like domain-containing protein n=1 Tax=Streptomyces sp. AD55 TaxID=3242895 RepID=UPI003528F1E0
MVPEIDEPRFAEARVPDARVAGVRDGGARRASGSRSAPRSPVAPALAGPPLAGPVRACGRSGGHRARTHVPLRDPGHAAQGVSGDTALRFHAARPTATRGRPDSPTVPDTPEETR